MAVVRCSKGHYYDDVKYNKCPHCSDNSGSDESVTMAMSKEKIEDIALEYVKRKVEHNTVKVEMDDEKTVGIYSVNAAVKKVCGWIVCMSGELQGKDFPLYTGFNRIGSGFDNDIVIKNDSNIEKKEHASIVYENKKNTFYIVPQEANFVYVNGELKTNACEIKSSDTMEIGETKFTFIAFCVGERKWE